MYIGYFQLQANPGIWRLSLATGRATQLFTIDNSVFTLTDSGSKWLISRSFVDNRVTLGVTKRPGKESVSLLLLNDGGVDEENEGENTLVNTASGIWSSLSTSLFGTSKPAPTRPLSSHNTQSRQSQLQYNDDDNRIHVFSLATGHMYERLLRIMMLSVTKRTSMPVKVSKI